MKDIKGFDRLLICATVAYYAATFLMVAYYSTRFIMVGCVFFVAYCLLLRTRGRLMLRVEPFHLFTFSFVAYCFFTALWAADIGLTLNLSKTILLTLILLYLLYLYYQKKPLHQLLLVVMLGGYAVCLIVLAAQGVGTYLNAIRFGYRIYEEKFINANMLGMLAASSVVLNFYYIIYEKRIRWWTILAVPALICLVGAGSKKSVLLLAGGVFLLIVLRNTKNIKPLLSLKRLAFLMLLLVVTVFLLNQTPLLSPIVERFEGVINLLTGSGELDVSTAERVEMIKVGVQIFKRAPILGVGIDNPRLFNVRLTYLHVNYLELLAGGGIIGFAFYYSMYAYLLHAMWKYRAYRTREYDICLTLILIHLALEFAYVAYYDKDTYFYFMVFFLEVKRLKEAARSRQNNERTDRCAIIHPEMY